MRGSRLDLTRCEALRPLAELATAIEAASPESRALLVGAMARDLLLTHAHGLTAERATEDIDFGFALKNWAAYRTLLQALLDSGESS